MIEKASKLDNVRYEIRGPVLDEANRMIADGAKVLKLNIGNPAPFGFTTRAIPIQKAFFPPVRR